MAKMILTGFWTGSGLMKLSTQSWARLREITLQSLLVKLMLNVFFLLVEILLAYGSIHF